MSARSRKLEKQPLTGEDGLFAAESRRPRARNWLVLLAIGVGGIIVGGIALFSVVATMAPPGSSPITTVRLAEVIRIGGARPNETIPAHTVKPTPDPNNMPAPQGTVGRMEGISKAFSKQ